MKLKEKILFYWNRANLNAWEFSFLSGLILFLIYIGITAPSTVTKKRVCDDKKVIEIESIYRNTNQQIMAVVILENKEKKKVFIPIEGIKANSMIEICEIFISKD